MLRPSASSPWSVAEPSASGSPIFTTCPSRMIGTWLTQVFWFERRYLMRLKTSSRPEGSSGVDSPRRTIRLASTFSMTPSQGAVIVTPESRAAMPSTPVPTSGASRTSRGTAWRCMFEPISARLASSCSRNGISAVATETICFGDTSIISISSGGASSNSPLRRAETFWEVNFPAASSAVFAWAMT